MTVKELCKRTGARSQTVYYNIKKYEGTELAGHIIRADGKSVELDDFAAAFLSPRSVLVKEIIQCRKDMSRSNALSQKQYVELKARSDEVQSSLAKAEYRIKELEFCYDSEEFEHNQTKKALEKASTELEQATRKLKEAKQELGTVKSEKESAEQQLQECEAHISDLENDAASQQAETDRLRSMINTLPERIKKKYSLYT